MQALSVGMFDNPARSQAMPISIASIRLVYPIRNPETGVTRDVVINQLKAVPPNMKSESMTLERWEYGNKWDRLVPGINVVIPWPEVEAPEFETHPADTVREQAEDRTFHYSLLSPPMPEQVVDELRNKYSRFRTRHEPWYVEQKEAEEEARKGLKEAAKSMQTPLDEFHEMQREIRDSQGEPELTDEMLGEDWPGHGAEEGSGVGQCRRVRGVGAVAVSLWSWAAMRDPECGLTCCNVATACAARITAGSPAAGLGDVILDMCGVLYITKRGIGARLFHQAHNASPAVLDPLPNLDRSHLNPNAQ